MTRSRRQAVARKNEFDSYVRRSAFASMATANQHLPREQTPIRIQIRLLFHGCDQLAQIRRERFIAEILQARNAARLRGGTDEMLANTIAKKILACRKIIVPTRALPSTSRSALERGSLFSFLQETIAF